jgi:hypothetical protein
MVLNPDKQYFSNVVQLKQPILIKNKISLGAISFSLPFLKDRKVLHHYNIP